MNDFLFGNKIYEERKKLGLTQAALAHKVGVTPKAVSKWETGKAKPTTNALRKLAALFGSDVSELLALRQQGDEVEITRIVITGGPCAGKSTAMSRIQEEFSQRGYRVLIIPETASELIKGGVSPRSCKTKEEYQSYQMHLQLEKEKIFTAAAKGMGADKVLIVCDRGTLDNKAYMDEGAFAALAKELGSDETRLRDRYDAVFHLVTAAKGAKEGYNTHNNAARTETPEEAAKLDDKLIAAWTGHPHLRIIDNSGSFEEKIQTLLAEIAAFLGIPKPHEIERKFLIDYPDIKALEENPNCKRVEIIQTYLKSESGNEVRIRQRGIDGCYSYYKTEKRKISGIRRIEIEQRLTQEEYLSLLMEADDTKRQIRKTRYCLTFENQYFEIDIYPFWQDKAIAEIELRSEDTPITFPKEITVIAEVTDDEAYKNAALAQIQ